QFIGVLAETRSVLAACRRISMGRESAYRLRKRDGAQGFAHAWDRVLAPPGTGHCPKPKPDGRKVTNAELFRRMETGLVQPVIYRGRMAGIRRKPDDSALLRLLRRHGRIGSWPELQGLRR
ncbi:MAG: hypothetical protein JKY36_00060, partial [Erythrobacter sp.]|nr:hypothetical protein [Erythrobacter sp.]